MQVFTKKKIIQKITIVLVILMLFNFIIPNCVRAETAIETAGKVLFTPIRGLLVMCGDAVMSGLQYLFVSNEKAVLSAKDIQEVQGEDVKVEGTDLEEWVGSTFIGDVALASAGFEDLPNFKYTPQSIFEGSVKSFDINFIKSRSTTNSEDKEDGENIEDEKTPTTDTSNITTTTWYQAYTKSMEYMKEQLATELSNNTETSVKAGVIASVLKKMGAQGLTGIYDSKNVDQITYTPEQALLYVKSIATKYNNGTSLPECFDWSDANTEYNNTLYNYIYYDDSNVRGVIATYIMEIGTEDNSSPTMGPKIDYDANAPVNALHNMIASWYKIMRNIALLFLLSILVYVGIRIMMSSTAADAAKYKKMLIDWVVAICLLFALHYIMAFTNSMIDIVVDAFSTGSGEVKWVDNIFGTVRVKLQGDSLSDQLFYTILYAVLVMYTGIFTVYYLKRVVYAAFLTLIAPLVSLTYPLDRMGDGKSQAFNFWLKEYVANAIIQPVHLLIYTVLVSSVFSLAEVNPLYALVVMGAMIPVEKFIREMFGLNSSKGPGPAGNFAAGALTMNAFGKLMHGKPPMPHGHLDKKGDSSGSAGTEKKPKIKTTKDASSSDYTDIIDDGGFKSPDNKNADGGADDERSGCTKSLL